MAFNVILHWNFRTHIVCIHNALLLFIIFIWNAKSYNHIITELILLATLQIYSHVFVNNTILLLTTSTLLSCWCFTFTSIYIQLPQLRLICTVHNDIIVVLYNIPAFELRRGALWIICLSVVVITVTLAG